MPYIARNLHAKAYQEGETIIVKGDYADWMYVLYKGSVEVILDDSYKGAPIIMENGAYFGHTGLQKEEKRSATIQANEYCETLILYNTDFDKVIKEQK